MTKVAVVAVHGVADQKPAESARSIADLLSTDGSFSSFTEVPLRIPRRRMKPGAAKHDDAGLQYMKEQLEGYDGGATGAVYDTVRLEGKSGASDVHVHEVYWADLSRAGDTWYRLLAEFYQLILHLPSLGRNGLKAAAKSGGIVWKSAYALHRLAVWLLTVPALLINLAMLSVALVALSGEIPEGARRTVALGVATVILAGIPIAAMRAMKARKLLWHTWIPILGLAAVAARQLIAGRNLFEVIALEAALVGALICLAISVAYTAMKKHAWLYGAIASGVMLVIAYGFIQGKVTNKATAYMAALRTVETIYPAIVVTWALIFTVAVVAAIAGIAAVLTTKGGERMAAYRATWTARFSFGLPVALFAIFTLSIWYLVVQGIGTMAERKGDVAESFAATMTALLFDSTIGLEYFIGAFVVFLAAALYAAAPSIAVEIRHPLRSTDDESQDLGRWLTRGIRCVAVAAEAFTLALVVLLVLAVCRLTGMTDVVEALSLSKGKVMPLLGATAGGLALLLTGKRFIKTFRAAVDVLLDIDNYLRESPKDATPRARIAERFVSLLRHLCAWRDADGQPYDRIVIVAHSQGTVISADCLRYLNRVPDAGLRAIHENRLSLRLFTMGSPLRQLYAKAFPYLYSWIKDEPMTQTLVSPDPTTLTLRQWANVYRSGDYVGRNLWVIGEDRLWIRADPVPVSNDPVVDFCAGVGAHTHYWNQNGAEVAAYLKSLV